MTKVKKAEINESSENDSDVEKLSKNVKKMSVKGKKKPVSSDENDGSDEEIAPAPKKSGKPKKGGFAILKVESDEDLDNLTDEEEEIEVKSKPKEPQGKKTKKAKKKRNDSDEDIDKVLAELQMEYSGVKKDPSQAEEKPAKQEDEDDGNEDEGSSLKTAAQKKKEKKERQKKELALAKQQEAAGVKPEPKKPKPVKVEKEVKPDEEETKEDETEKVDKKKKKKDKKEKSDEKEKEKEKGKKGPGNKIVAAMQEQLKKIREEEEKLQREEEDKIRIAEAGEEHRLEQVRLDQEKKEKKKLKEKERKERLKSEGKLLTAKQKLDKARAQDMLESLKAQGIEIPEVGEKRPARAGTRIRQKKKDQNQSENKDLIEDKKSEVITEIIDEKAVAEEEVPEPIEDVKDAWDASSSSEDESEEKPDQVKKTEATTKKQKSEESSESESDDDDDSDSESESESEDNHRDDAEKRKQKVRERLEQRKIDAEEKRSLDNLRAAVVCVLGHVDTGKTKILDKLRRTNVQDGEAGGITQQIGATNVPIETIKEQTKMVKGASDMIFKLPGLLIIDTPGHESFSNLRSRGSSLCDIAILVVDIMHGLEPQTIESLNLLKSKKTPFIVALNKIDRLYDWQTTNRKDVRDTFKAQAANTQVEFTQRTKEVILQFAEQGLNAALFNENPDPRTYVSMVPTSAITGEGMGNLLYLIIENCQNLLAKRLMYSEELSATVLEGMNILYYYFNQILMIFLLILQSKQFPD